MALVHETRIVIGTADCDALGHMNVARYIGLCNVNGFAMLTAMGWPPGQERDGLRLSFAVVQMDSQFLAEVLEGETLIVASNILRIGTKSATFRNRIRRDSGEAVFCSLWVSACLNLDTRRGEVIPDALRADLARYLDPDA